MNRVEHQQAFILKSQSYKESSVIHQMFSIDYGVVSIISKGSKSKISKVGSVLHPFRQLAVSWVGKSDLKTLTSSEQLGELNTLKGNGLYCGFYVNELILNLLHKFDGHPVLFTAYQKVMYQLASNENLQNHLREFEKILLQEIGYGLQLDHVANSDAPIDADLDYTYVIGKGVVESSFSSNEQRISGSTLNNLRDNCLATKQELIQAKKLMRRLIDYQLDGKILKSRELFL
jgi:DNA repair protein RecO (recombination protein O)